MAIEIPSAAVPVSAVDVLDTAAGLIPRLVTRLYAELASPYKSETSCVCAGAVILSVLFDAAFERPS